MRAVVAALAALAVLLGLPAPAAAQAAAPEVVVIGVAGLRWDDLTDDMPQTRALAARGAVGALSVKALPAVTCPGDGWLTLGAGARAAARPDDDDPGGSCDQGLPGLGRALVEGNADSRDGAVLGLLADEVPVSAVGPGAALAAAGRDVPDGRVRLVDAGVLGEQTRDRPAQRRAVDAAVGAALAAAGAADVLLVGLSEGPQPEPGVARLHVAVAAGPSYERGTLRSASTRRDGLVQLVDVTATVLDLVGSEVPDDVDGQPWQVRGAPLAAGALVDLDARAAVGKRTTVPLFATVLVLLALGLAATARRPRAARAVALAGTAFPGATFAAMLVPWWRAGQPFLAALALVLALSAAAAALASRTRHPVAWVAGATFALLVVDLVTGARLQLEAPAGYSSLVAGRFAGIGNVAFGVYATCALLLAASLRRLRWVALVGVVAVVVDGAPPFGSDVGGVLALLPALVVLAMLLTGTRVSPLRLLLAGLAGALVVTAFALADWSRAPGDRTHLGRFVEQVADGTAGEVLQRKAAAVLGLLFANPVTALLPLVVAGTVYLFLRPPPPVARAFAAEPTLRAALVAVGLLALVGFAVNDSGAAVVALAVVVVLPATAAVVAGVAAGRQGAPPA